MAFIPRLFTEITLKTRSVNYLLEYRLRWGEPDKLTLLPSALSSEEMHVSNGVLSAATTSAEAQTLDPEEVQCFKANTPRNLICIIQNDWPYSGERVIYTNQLWGSLP